MRVCPNAAPGAQGESKRIKAKNIPEILVIYHFRLQTHEFLFLLRLDGDELYQVCPNERHRNINQR